MHGAISQEHGWSCFLQQPQTFEVTGIQESPCSPKHMASKHQAVGLTENEPLPFLLSLRLSWLSRIQSFQEKEHSQGTVRVAGCTIFPEIYTFLKLFKN